MKTLFSFLGALFLLVFLLCFAIYSGARYFLHDIVSLHGERIAGMQLHVSPPEIEWRHKRVVWRNWVFTSGVLDKGDSLSMNVVIGSVGLQLAGEWMVDAGAASFARFPIRFSTLSLDGVDVPYDLDADGGVLRDLRSAVSAAAAGAVAAKSYAVSSGTYPSGLFDVDRVVVSDVTIRLIGEKVSVAPENIRIPEIILDNLGKSDRGMTAEELSDKISLAVFDGIYSELLKRNFIDASQSDARRKASVSDEKYDAADRRGKSTSGVARKTSEAVKKASKEIGRTFKELFD